MNNNTLVIHPIDNTTCFLNNIYTPISNKTVIQKDRSKEEVNQLINSHDHIMMMGHGSNYGLFSVGVFNNSGTYIIDPSTAELLKSKTNIFIWCYASDYVSKYNLNGFATGMFISEVYEAIYCGLKNISQEMVDESNMTFVNTISEIISMPPKEIYHYVINSPYKELAKSNPVAAYNYQRLYFR